MILTEEMLDALPMITEDEYNQNVCDTEELMERIWAIVEEGLKDFDEEGNPIIY